MELYDEKQLLVLLKEQKTVRRGFEILVRQYREKLYWQIRRIVLFHEDADDVLQNTFIKAWNSIESFHGDSKLFTWLSRIAINESLDFIRKKKVRQTISADDESMGVANQLLADSFFDGDETAAQLQEAIAELPDVQRTVFQLRYFDEMKYSEISKITGTSEGGLKASYHIAVKKIEDFFHRHD